MCAWVCFQAARTSGFPRTQGDIVRVMKVCGCTVRTRLLEFQATPAAQLTLEELEGAEEELSLEQDPPAFVRGIVAPLALEGRDALEADGAASLALARALKPKERRQKKRDSLYEEMGQELDLQEGQTGGRGEEGGEESEVDEEELSGFVLSAAEAQKKESIWTEMNKEYLEQKVRCVRFLFDT